MKRCINFAFVCLFGVSAVVFACKSGDVDALVPPGHVAIGLNKSVRVASNLVVQVDSIHDSRCPRNATCIAAGSTAAGLTLTAETESKKILLSSDFDYKNRVRRDSTAIQFQRGSYSVVLRDVIPYPEAFTDLVNRPQQQAVIQVSKL